MSRLPPLPPGLPPRPDSAMPRGGDSYRPSNNENHHPSHSSLPASDMYYFRGGGGRGGGGGGGSYDSKRSSHYPPPRPRSPPRWDPINHPAPPAPRRSPPRDSYVGAGDSYRPAEFNFSFRSDAPPGAEFRPGPAYRPRSPPAQRSRHDDHGRRARQNNHGDNYRGARGGYGYRGRGGPRLASEREFLKGNRAPTPELMPGMEDDESHRIKFRPIEDVSDSEDAEMDLSADGNEEEEEEAEKPRKKQARTEYTAADGDSIPKWSNPDPYTVLPPPDESQRKKKDMVKLIRKARVTSGTDNAGKVDNVLNDFISFDFDAPEDDLQEGRQESRAVPNAPTGPRSQVSEGHQRDFVNSTLSRRLDVPLKPNKASAVIDLTTDPALGNRKRDIRDEIKGPPLIHQTMKGKKRPVNGTVLPEWRVRAGVAGAPWLGIDHSGSVNMGLWLHKEIMDFYHYVKPQDFEQVIRSKLVEDLRSVVKRSFASDADIRTFGSFPASLYLPTADMDLVLVSDEYMRGGHPVFGQTNSAIHKFSRFLLNQKLPLPESIEVITKAKVPLVKYVDGLTGLKVDISFENDTGLIANKTFQDWKKQFPAMPILVTLIKHLLATRGLNEPVNGGIGGFSVTCLVVSLLQLMPQVQSGSMIPEHHLGEILMEFLDLYGNQFNTATTAIQFDPPGYVTKDRAGGPYNRNSNQEKFSIIDPNNPQNDISGGASNTRTIRACFSQCYDDLQKRMGELQYSAERRNQSILSCILAGDYTSFELQREHLRHVHEKLFGPV